MKAQFVYTTEDIAGLVFLALVVLYFVGMILVEIVKSAIKRWTK